LLHRKIASTPDCAGLPATGRKRHMKKTLLCLSAADLKDVPEPCDFLFEAER
jgi:hypothetical protein